MPELPEVQALAGFLTEHAVGRVIGRVDLASMSVLKTFDPPVTALPGRTVTAVGRYGKFLDVDCDGTHLVIHLARAGWLRWSDNLSATPPKPGRGPLALRAHLGVPGSAPGFDLTEAGTRKRLAVWIVTDPASIEPLAALGPDALSLTGDDLRGILTGRTERLKNLLTDQRTIAGIGNAYSDEILHVAGLSPFAVPARLSGEAVDRLHEALIGVLSDALARSVGQEAARLKGEKRSGLRVHARTGLPCPVCGDTVREVAFADRSLQYCATCQTGGRPLADRRMSRLLR